MNIILNTDQSYDLTELAKALDNSPDDLFYVVKKVDGKDVSYAITREQLIQGISGGGGDSIFIVRGGVFYTGTLLDFDIDVVVSFFGVSVTIVGTVTLDVGDSQPRRDTIWVDADGGFGVIKGTPDANPFPPAVGEGQFALTDVLVNAFATTPEITLQRIYREGFEAGFTGVTYAQPSGSTQYGSVDFTSAIDPCQGTQSIRVNTSRTTGIRINFGSTLDISNFDRFACFVRFPNGIGGNKNLLMSVWEGGSSVAPTINYHTFGLSRTDTSCQLIEIPTSLFPTQNIDRLQIRLDGGPNPQIDEWYIDDIFFTTGTAASIPLDVITVQDGGANVGTRPKLNFIEGTNVTFDIADDAINDRVNITVNATAGGGGIVNSVVGTATQIDVDATDPANPIVSLASEVTTSLGLADSAVQSVVAGTGISVDATDPQNPIVTNTQTPGGQVDSVSGTVNEIDVAGTATDPVLSLAAPVISSLGLADSSVQPGDNVSDLNNDAGYIDETDVTGTSRSYTQGQGFTIEDLTITAGTPNVVNWSVDTSNMKRLVLNADAELQVPTGSLNVTGSIEVENDGGFTLTFAAGLSADYILGDTPTTTDTEFFLITYEKRGSRIWLVVNNQNI